MSNASQVLSSYIEEVTFGTMPSGALKDMRITSHSIKRLVDLVRSNEIRSDRQNAELIPAGVSVAGQIPGELSYGTWDDFLQYSLQASAWSAAPTATGVVFAMQTGPTKIHRSTGSFLTDFGLTAPEIVGRWVKVVGFAGAGNNGIFKVTVCDLDDITLAYAAGTPSVEAEGASVTITLLGQITNGTTQKSIAIEDKFSDLASTFRVFEGITFNGFDLTLQESGPVLISFDVMGKDERSTTATGGTSNTAVNSNPVMSSGLNVAQLNEGVALQTSFARARIALRNNLRPRKVLGSISVQSFGAGDCQVNGDFDNYFSSGTIAAKVIAFTESILVVILRDSLGNGYVLEMPATKYSEGARTPDSKNSDVFGKYVFDTKRSASEGITIRWARFAA